MLLQLERDVVRVATKHGFERDVVHDLIVACVLDLMKKHNLTWNDTLNLRLIRRAVACDVKDHIRKINAAFRRAVKFVSSESIPEGHVHAAQRHNGKPLPINRCQDDDLVDDLLGCLDEREFLVVTRCVLGHHPQAQVANELGVSRQMVGKIRDRAIATMRSRYEKL